MLIYEKGARLFVGHPLNLYIRNSAKPRHPFVIGCFSGGQLSQRLAGSFSGDQTFALGMLARQFASAANCFSLFAGTLFRRLFIKVPQLHFTEDALTLQLLLKSAESLINIVVTDDDLHGLIPFLRFKLRDLVCIQRRHILQATNKAPGTLKGTDWGGFTQS